MYYFYTWWCHLSVQLKQFIISKCKTGVEQADIFRQLILNKSIIFKTTLLFLHRGFVVTVPRKMIRNAKKKCEKQLGNVDISEPTVHHGLRENNLQT